MPEYEIPRFVQENWHRRNLGTPSRPCGEGVGNGQICGTTTRELLPSGWRCDEHRPAVPTPDPTRTLAGLSERVIDEDLVEQERQLLTVRISYEWHPDWPQPWTARRAA